MKANKDRATIVQKVINGHDGVPPVPDSGESPQRRKDSPRRWRQRQRAMLPVAEVPISEVQASGLLKDTILLHNPDKDGQVDTTLLRKAVQYAVAQSQRWEDYCVSQGLETVLPLLVIPLATYPRRQSLSAW